MVVVAAPPLVKGVRSSTLFRLMACVIYRGWLVVRLFAVVEVRLEVGQLYKQTAGAVVAVIAVTTLMTV